MNKLLLLLTTALLLQILPVTMANHATTAEATHQPIAAVSSQPVISATSGSISNPRVREIVKTLNMTSHPEGGWFAEVYTAPTTYKSIAGTRPLAGSIYFLLDGKDISHFHQLDCDEIWYYHEGSGMRLYLLDKDGSVMQKLLGQNLANGQRPMVIIPAGKIFAAENIDSRSYTLISCATTPKFNYKGWRLVGQAELLKLSPQKQTLIKRLS